MSNEKKGVGKKVGFQNVKYRKFYDIVPSDRIHREGKHDGYDRTREKRDWRDELEEERDEEDDQN